MDRVPVVKYVDVRKTVTATWHDPTRYLEELASFQGALPAGARSFATDPEHYDFQSARCVKDLGLESIMFEDGLVVTLSGNEFSHGLGTKLVLRYAGVKSVEVRSDEDDGYGTYALSLRLDEILPHEHGLSHEFRFDTGSMLIVAVDLTVEWVDEGS